MTAINKWVKNHSEILSVFGIGAIAVIFPLIPLFNFNKGFFIDWYNHLWMIGYYGEYFSVHKVMPAVLNTNQTLLIAFPTFYGYFLYTTLGTLSIWTGANIAVRIGILILWILKFGLAYHFAMELSKDKALSLSIGILTCWEIYPLTNLYNRGALTEVFATGLLTILFYSGMLALYKRANYQKIAYFLLAGLAASLLSMSHPITMLFGFIFLGVIFLIIFFFNIIDSTRVIGRVSLILAITILASYIICVISPWAYATLTFKDRLNILSTAGNYPDIYYDSIDNILVRFSPFPFDRRSLYDGIYVTGSTPYLDAQINIPLLILVVVLFVNKQHLSSLTPTSQNNAKLGNLILWASIILFFISTSTSMSPLFYKYSQALNIVQFAYRMVSYQNLFIVIMVISLLLTQKHLNLPTGSKLITLTICLTLAGNSLLIKFWHIQASADAVPQDQRYDSTPKNMDDLLNLPHTFYGLDNYALKPYPLNKRLSTLPSKSVNLLLKKGDFGEIEMQSFVAPKESWILTNVAFSPWNEVLIDGVPSQNMSDINGDSMADVLVTPGKHNISARFAPDQTFQFLRRVSNFAFSMWTFTTIISFGFFSIRSFFQNTKGYNK